MSCHPGRRVPKKPVRGDGKIVASWKEFDAQRLAPHNEFELRLTTPRSCAAAFGFATVTLYFGPSVKVYREGCLSSKGEGRAAGQPFSGRPPASSRWQGCPR